MGLLEKIFGSKGPKIVEIELGNASDFLEKELSPKRKQLLDSSAKKLSEVKHLILEARSSLKEFEKAQASKKSARVDKIVKTAKSNTLLQIASLLDKLNPPNTSDLEAVRVYCIESGKALHKAGHFGKNVAYAGISFKDEMKVLGGNMRKLSAAFSSLKDLIDENKGIFLKPVLQGKLVELREAGQSIAHFEEEAVSLEAALKEKALEENRVKSKLRRLRESPEFKSIDALNGEKASLLRQKQNARTEIIDMFAKVEKPLHRLDKAVKARKVFLRGKQAEILHMLLQNPFKALKLDPKAEVVKEIMVEAKKAIESGLIELKEKVKEKKLAILQELISFDFFSESFWKFNKIDSGLLSLEKKLNELSSLKEETALLKELREKGLQKAQIGAEIESKKSNAAEAKKTIFKLKMDIQGLLSEALGKEVFLKG